MSDSSMSENEEAPRFVDKRAASRLEADAGEAASASAEADAASAAAPQEVLERLAQAEAQAQRFEESWKRAAADFSNYKRRVEQERSDQARLASAALVINLLPIRDDFGRAMETIDSTLAGLNWVQGVLAIERKLEALLESMGVTEVAAEGEVFDPREHEAVGRAPGPENICLHVLQKGYALQGAVIRPAMVIVGDGSEADAPGSDASTTTNANEHTSGQAAATDRSQEDS